MKTRITIIIIAIVSLIISAAIYIFGNYVANHQKIYYLIN